MYVLRVPSSSLAMRLILYLLRYHFRSDFKGHKDGLDVLLHCFTPSTSIHVGLRILIHMGYSSLQPGEFLIKGCICTSRVFIAVALNFIGTSHMHKPLNTYMRPNISREILTISCISAEYAQRKMSLKSSVLPSILTTMSALQKMK